MLLFTLDLKYYYLLRNHFLHILINDSYERNSYALLILKKNFAWVSNYQYKEIL